MDLNLQNKVAIITGGGRGIGEAICMAFANEGAHIVVSDVDNATANEVCERIKEMGIKAITVETDISKEKDVNSLIDSTIKEFGRIDVLVNNAGISPKKEGGPTITWKMTKDEWEKVLAVNLSGTLLCSQKAVKYMLTEKTGAIVNISSIAGKAPNEPMPIGIHYSVSKAGIINMTQKMAKELAEYGIRVNAVAPGRIETAISKASSSEANEIMLKRTPIGRFGTPEEIANLVIFLSSDASSYITGETVNINGGWFMD